jgi:hypothetical protein
MDFTPYFQSQISWIFQLFWSQNTQWYRKNPPLCVYICASYKKRVNSKLPIQPFFINVEVKRSEIDYRAYIMFR